MNLVNLVKLVNWLPADATSTAGLRLIDRAVESYPNLVNLVELVNLVNLVDGPPESLNDWAVCGMNYVSLSFYLSV